MECRSPLSPSVERRPTAEIATPYWPASALHARIVTAMESVGMDTENMPTPRP
jgi:hypothetical protein